MKYLVHYGYSNRDKVGDGNTVGLEMPHYPPTKEDIIAAQETIKKANGHEVVAIYNFLPLSE